MYWLLIKIRFIISHVKFHFYSWSRELINTPPLKAVCFHSSAMRSGLRIQLKMELEFISHVARRSSVNLKSKKITIICYMYH